MARYKVTVKTSVTEFVDAENPYMAAVTVAERHGRDAEIADVRPAGGRSAGPATGAKPKRQISPEAKARLAQNLVKARAARAAKRQAAKKPAGKKPAAKKPARKPATKKPTGKKPARRSR